MAHLHLFRLTRFRGGSGYKDEDEDEDKADTSRKQIQCLICYKNLIKNEINIHCGHTFHKACLKEWNKTCIGWQRCPECHEITEWSYWNYRDEIKLKRERADEIQDRRDAAKELYNNKIKEPSRADLEY